MYGKYIISIFISNIRFPFKLKYRKGDKGRREAKGWEVGGLTKFRGRVEGKVNLFNSATSIIERNRDSDRRRGRKGVTPAETLSNNSAECQ